MKFPISLHIGDFELPLHAIFEFAAFFIGFRYFLYLRKKQVDPISTNHRVWILIAAIFGAVVGSRIVGGLEDPEQLRIRKDILLHFYQNKTVLGGFLGGLWAVEIAKYFLKEKHSSGDLFTFPMILALIIGRIGCFSMGVYEETYGTITNFFTGMDLGDGMMRHPVTLYEIVFLLCLWISIVFIEKHSDLTEGGRFKLFMIAYCSFRFFLDFIKPSYIVIAGLSTIQLTALLGLTYYFILWLQSQKQNATSFIIARPSLNSN